MQKEICYGDLRDQEKDVYYSKMNNTYWLGWKQNKKTVKKVNDAAKQSAKNIYNANTIAKLVHDKPTKVLRIAMLIRAFEKVHIDVAFSKIKFQLKKGKSWEEIKKDVLK